MLDEIESAQIAFEYKIRDLKSRDSINDAF